MRGKDLVAKQLGPVAGMLLTPVAAAGYGLAAWRFAADMRWTGEFFIDDGLLSRWQVWLAIAVATHLVARHVDRPYQNDDRSVTP
jgi:hypothetical protein